MTKTVISKSSKPASTSQPQPKPDGGLFGSSQNPGQPQLQQFQEQPGRFLDPGQEMRRQSSFGQAEATQQLGLSALASQFGAGLGNSAAASQQRRDSAQAMDDRQRGVVRTTSARSTAGMRRDPNVLSAQLAERAADQQFIRDAIAKQQDNYYNTGVQNRDFQNNQVLQNQQQNAALREEQLRTQAQLASANIGAQSSMFGSMMGALGNMFGSIGIGGGGGRYW